MLEISHLQKYYGASQIPAVADFNLKVDTGEFVTLIGPSGCGKTTALRIVTGLLEASAGTVLVNGKVSDGPSRDKAIVFQLFNLFPWRTALSNVAYGLELHGVGKEKRLAVAREYLELVGLADRLHHYPSQLSGGQNQRVGLARALAIEPKLLLMDEPFGSLDALTREHLQELVHKICDEKNLTVLFVTHSVDEAIYLSDRIIVMGTPGRVVGEFKVGLAKPRHTYDWRATPEYTHIRSDIWKLLRTEISPAEALA
ncbi:MAG TPA: ABC transporter ATP-binding protein [Gaiellaceae bacterium]|jgi:NitT/TauT family transport system ATP-binding protein